MSKYDLSKLNPMQFQVTQKNATEPPFKNEFYKFYSLRWISLIPIVDGQVLLNQLKIISLRRKILVME